MVKRSKLFLVLTLLKVNFSVRILRFSSDEEAINIQWMRVKLGPSAIGTFYREEKPLHPQGIELFSQAVQAIA